MTPLGEHPASLDVDRLAAHCVMRRTRRSGPGGQNRNKVETAVVLTHEPTGICAEASERRSQAENRKVALFRLRVNLALEVRSRRTDQPVASARWRSRCVGERIVVSASHDDFPALLAEALDIIEASRWDVRSAAAVLECTSTQLIKFLKIEPRALRLVNDHRARLQLHPLV